MMRTIATAAVLGLASAVAFVSPASAAGGLDQGGDGGYKISVHVTISGADAGRIGKAGGTSMSVQPTCWWALYNPTIDGTDATTPEGFQKFYDESIPHLTGHAAQGRLSMPTYDEVRRVSAAAANGEHYRWYQLNCRPGVDAIKAGYAQSGGTYLNQQVAISWAAFPDGQPPEPYVAPKDLAVALWDYAQQGLTNPAIDRNPKVAANGGAAVVNLPTWFWVTNPATSLADDGKVDLVATAGNSTVTLSAASSDVSFTSAAGETSCSVAQAKQAYSAGKSDAGACKISFESASAGWPVTASISWGGTWTGNDGTEGVLPQVFHSTTVNVPVVEIQVPNR
jgi:hypothetical protein